jgi:hypothetical protein
MGGSGDKLVDREPVRMIVGVRANDDSRHEKIIRRCLVDVLAGLHDRNLYREGQSALHHAGLMDQRRACCLRMAQKSGTLQLLEIALGHVAAGKRVPAAKRELAARRVQLFRVVEIVDVVRCDGGLNGPLEQLGVIDNRTVDRCQGTREPLTVRDEEQRPDGMNPDIRVMDERQAEKGSHCESEPKASGHECSLEVRIGQPAGDRVTGIAHLRLLAE